MSLPRTDLLITEVRVDSNNEDYGDDYGVGDEQFLLWLNHAQTEVQSFIIEEDCQAFVDYYEIDIVANVGRYAVPPRIFAKNLVYGIAYSNSGNEEDYYDLCDMTRRLPLESGDPEEFIIDGGYIFLDAAPTSSGGTLRVRYEASLDEIDIRRGTVESVTTGATYKNVLTIVLSDGTDEKLESAEWVCVNDSRGNVKMRNIPIASWDSSSLTLTVEDDFEADDDATEIEAGDYLTIGENTTTHSKLERVCRPYIVTASSFDAMRNVSSTDTAEQSTKLSRLRKQIIGVYEKLPSGKQMIPETRRGF